jgi:hypothetical protein
MNILENVQVGIARLKRGRHSKSYVILSQSRAVKSELIEKVQSEVLARRCVRVYGAFNRWQGLLAPFDGGWPRKLSATPDLSLMCWLIGLLAYWLIGISAKAGRAH